MSLVELHIQNAVFDVNTIPPSLQKLVVVDSHLLNDADWPQMPCEMARLFVHRFRAFMDKFILGDRALLGKVKHSVVKWEVQGRGSLHTHVLLWIEPEDVDRVSAQISGAMPADLDANKKWFPPDDPFERRLFDILQAKMIHTHYRFPSKDLTPQTAQRKCVNDRVQKWK